MGLPRQGCVESAPHDALCRVLDVALRELARDLPGRETSEPYTRTRSISIFLRGFCSSDPAMCPPGSGDLTKVSSDPGSDSGG